MKLKEYMLYWYNTYRLPRQQKITQIVNMSLISNHIIGSDIGEMELADVTTRDIQEFLTEELLHGKKTVLKNLDLRGTSLSPHTIIKLRQLLIAMFRQAAKENLVLCNAAENTEPLPLPWHDSAVFTPESQRKFLAAASNHRYYVAYVLLFYMGCRRGEILGLSWDSIDFRRNILTIRQELLLENNEIVLKKHGKTRNSIRTIPFPQEIKYLLNKWRQKQKDESRGANYKNEHNLVFCNKDGSTQSCLF